MAAFVYTLLIDQLRPAIPAKFAPSMMSLVPVVELSGELNRSVASSDLERYL